MNLLRTRIKICGLRDAAALRAAITAGVDAVGFVVSEGSPRTIAISDLERLLPSVPAFVTPVAVVRNAPDDLLRQIRAIGDPRLMVQYHGDEDAATTGRFAVPFIRALAFDARKLRAWDHDHLVRLLLVDAPMPGSGTPFAYDELIELLPSLRTPIALAGGLHAGSVRSAIERVRPFAVDVSSGVESAPGVKDPQLIEAFCRAVRTADGM